MDYIVGNYKSKYRSYFDNTTYKIKKDISTENAVGAFLFAWIELEKMLKKHVATSYKDTFIRLNSLVDMGVLSKDEYDKVYKLRSVRNNLVHGIGIPKSDYLDRYTKEIKELTQSLKNKRQENNNGVMDESA